MRIEALVDLGIGALVLYRIFVWLRDTKRTPDPWGPEIGQALEQEETVPLCHRCLAPQEHNAWFCPECGSTVGKYSNYLPGVYIFSIGEAFRAGLTAPVRWRGLLVAGYIVVCVSYFSILAPLCLFFLLKNSGRGPDTTQDDG